MKYPIVAALLLTFGMGYCLVQGYKVEPKTAAQSGWTHGEDGYVSEIVTCCWDSLTDPAYIECFVGDGNPTGYQVEVKTYPGQVTVASGQGDAPHGHAWVRFSNLNVTHPELIVKGRQLEVRFSRASGSDSIQYYTSVGTTYLYGFMRTGRV